MSGKGQCALACVPVRAEARSQAELVTQLLYGESYSVLESIEDWIRIKIDFDNYEGWITSNQHVEVRFVPQDIQRYATYITNNGIVLPLGSELPNGVGKKALSLMDLANTFLGSPYLWGGKTFMGIDCSGFMQVIHKATGIHLPRDASQQIKHGTEVKYGEHKAEDLAFFGSPSGKINHVGLIVSATQIIHASGSVQIDRFTKQGVEAYEGRKQTHTLHSIKRLI